MFWKVAALCGATLWLASAQTPSVRVVEEIAAKVNGEIVTRGDLEQKKKDMEGELRAQGLTGKQLTDTVQQDDADALRDSIDELLLVQKAKEMPNLNVDPEVAKYFNEWQARAKITDPDKFHEWLREQSGMTFEELRDREKKQLMAQRIVGYEVASRIPVSDADMQKFYAEHKADFMRQEQVFLSQILISTEGKMPDQVTAAEAKAKDIVARARRGAEKFSDLARDNSDDPGTAQNGGYLGFPTSRGILRPEIETLVFAQKKGYISDPIKLTNPAGFLILKVEEHQDAGLASYEEVQEQIHDALAAPLMKQKVRDYLTQLRQEAYLQIKDGYVDTGAAPGKDTRWQEVATLKPPVTTKEEVVARAKPHKKVLFVPVPGTTAAIKMGKDRKPRAESRALDNPPPPKPAKKPLPPAPAVAPIKQ